MQYDDFGPAPFEPITAEQEREIAGALAAEAMYPDEYILPMFASGPDADWEAERFPDRHDPECFACAVCCL